LKSTGLQTPNLKNNAAKIGGGGKGERWDRKKTEARILRENPSTSQLSVEGVAQGRKEDKCDVGSCTEEKGQRGKKEEKKKEGAGLRSRRSRPILNDESIPREKIWGGNGKGLLTIGKRKSVGQSAQRGKKKRKHV